MMITEVVEGVEDLFYAGKSVTRQHRESMRRQGLVGWVLYHPTTGIVLRMFQTVHSAESAEPALSARHGVRFRALAVTAHGRAFEHVGGRAMRAAIDPYGKPVHIPLHGRRINRYGVRHSVAAAPHQKAAG